MSRQDELNRSKPDQFKRGSLDVPFGRYLELYPESWYLDRRQYAAMCSFWDSSIGNITNALKSKGIWDNTLFVFSSDNGGPAGVEFKSRCHFPIATGRADASRAG